MDDTPSPDALRELVREVLKDVLPTLAARNGSQSFASGTPPTQVSAPTGLRTASSGPSGPRPRSHAVPPTPPTSDPPPSPPAGMERVPGAAGVSGVHGAAGAGLVVGAFRTPGPGAYQTASESGVTMQPVRLATDEDLHEFVLQIVRLADNPKRRRDLLAGRFRFTLASTGFGPAPAGGPTNGRGSLVPAGHGGGDHRIERGAVTERAVQAAATAGARLVLGPRAVLTPLARDRARALGVPIEKER